MPQYFDWRLPRLRLLWWDWDKPAIFFTPKTSEFITGASAPIPWLFVILRTLAVRYYKLLSCIITSITLTRKCLQSALLPSDTRIECPEEMKDIGILFKSPCPKAKVTDTLVRLAKECPELSALDFNITWAGAELQFEKRKARFCEFKHTCAFQLSITGGSRSLKLLYMGGDLLWHIIYYARPIYRFHKWLNIKSEPYFSSTTMVVVF